MASRAGCTRVVCADPLSLVRFTPEVVRIPRYISAPLKAPFLSFAPSLYLAIFFNEGYTKVHFARRVKDPRRGIRGNPPPSTVPRPGFNCLHDKRTRSVRAANGKLVRFRQTFPTLSRDNKRTKIVDFLRCFSSKMNILFVRRAFS